MQYDKLSAGLQIEVDRHEAARGRGQQQLNRIDNKGGGFVAGNENKPERVIVFLYLNSEDDRLEDLGEGVVVNQSRGETRTAIVPLAAIERLSEHPKIKWIELSKKLQPQMNLARSAINYGTYDLNYNYRGRNVVVGVIDTGVDRSHPAIVSRNMISLWDQTISGSGVTEGGYGQEFAGASIAANSTDEDGHGTHVANGAIGSDSAAPAYKGLATSGRLVFVKTDFNSAHVADAVLYIFRKASELGLPAVINLSLGGHDGPHDGTDALDKVINQNTGPSKIAVCSAGNEGDDAIHALFTSVPADGIARGVSFSVPSNTYFVTLTGWYPNSAQLSAALKIPAGQTTPFQVIASGNTSGNSITTFGNLLVSISCPASNPNNNSYNIRVVVYTSDGSPIPTGNYQLQLKNNSPVASGAVDFWIIDDDISYRSVFTTRVVNNTKVGSPGSAAKAVTVGSYTSKSSYTDSSGTVQNYSSVYPQGAITPFTSPGPLRGGAILKPDMVAPGAMIVSARSQQALGFASYQTVNPYYVALSGTSMAAPIITGLIACMLEGDSAMGPATAKSRLMAASTLPGGTMGDGSWDESWGYGLVDASAL